MTDLRLHKRPGQDDREALEHIARALEGRVLSNPAAVGEPANVNGETGGSGHTATPSKTRDAPEISHDLPSHALPALDPAGVETLIEAMPAAIGILKGDALNTVNSAFAYAFGYRSPAELLDAGGLNAILPGGTSDLSTLKPHEPISDIAAVSRSRRRLSVTFIVTPLGQDDELRLLRLVDPSDLEPSDLEPSAIEPAPDMEEPSAEPDTEAPAMVAPLAADQPSVPAEPLQTATAPATPTKAVLDEVSADRAAADEAAKAAAKAAELRERTREAASRQLDFLAKVSHEVRTPLNSIIGFAELMQHERFGPIGNARYKGYAEDIHQSGLYALSLLNDLLDISKIEAGKFELDFTSVDAAEVVEACVASLQPLAKRTRILLRTSFADDLPLVLADPRRLRQILLNLLTNAIKFTREGGQVIVSGTMAGRELRLRVRDTGVGMSESDIAYAMQPFHQLDTSPRHQSGTGLGLPLTKALTDAIRARLVLTSEPGVGTSADVIFPKERLFRR
ncbi:MAG: HAMP domain-containing sensor histidine kinase [Methyloceanibacter sp.]|nr:HAMP domain-containing sensor histidine kinase [Methyloceanibacter sp.]